MKKYLKKIPYLKKFYIFLLSNLSKPRILNLNVESNVLEKLFNYFTPYDTNHELVRIGPSSDGGYLVPNDIEDIDFFISPGVGTISDFELVFAEKGVKCLLIDGSVETLPINHKNFLFLKKFLSKKDNYNHISLNSIINDYELIDFNNMFLQIDIEGSEFEVIESLSEKFLSKFRIIVIEFHNFKDILLDKNINYYFDIFEKINSHFTLLHLHPNNCSYQLNINKKYTFADVIEATYIRNDRVEFKSPSKIKEDKLDKKNCESNKGFNLKFWSFHFKHLHICEGAF